MALPSRGSWIQDTGSLQPYATAAVWGTGINPIHEIYGEGPPLRTSGREGYDKDGGVSAPANSSPQAWEPQPNLWGYEEPTGQYSGEPGVYLDDRPNWGMVPEDYRADTEDHPPWNAPRSASEYFRGMFGGAHRLAQKLADSIPSETVSEGWLNKARSYQEDAVVSDPSQYEVQTSMQQRNIVMGNPGSVARGTDEERTPIKSRIRGMKLKMYSEGERLYDMFPYQQDIIVRPFWNRTFGSGNPEEMGPNEMTLRSPVRRVPPNDPSMGPEETSLEGNDFGYTPEDTFYA